MARMTRMVRTVARTARWLADFADPFLNDPSQPLLFSMPSKLLILHGEAKSCTCFTVSCVPESMFNYL